MNETKQIKFPIAAVFCTLNVLLGFINIFMTYALLPRMPLDRLLVSLLLPGLSLISGIVLAVILYNRKRNLPLFLALGLELAICLFCIYGTVSEQSLMNSYWGRVRLFSQAITAVNALLFLVFAVSQDRKEESDMAKFLRKIWFHSRNFVPGGQSIRPESRIFGNHQSCTRLWQDHAYDVFHPGGRASYDLLAGLVADASV